MTDEEGREENVCSTQENISPKAEFLLYVEDLLSVLDQLDN